MSAFIKACGYRLISARCLLTSSNVAKNATHIFQDLGFPCLISRSSTSFPGEREFGRFTAKVLTDQDFDVHKSICNNLIGRKGKNIRQFISNTGLNFNVNATEGSDHLLVCGSNADDVKGAVEKVTQEVERIRNWLTSLQLERVSEKVITDEDADVHNSICKSFIGKGGKNFKSFLRKSGLDIEIDTKEDGYILVTSGSEDDLKSAVEKVKQEVQRIRSDVQGRISEKVPTDQDAVVHSKMCSILIGKGGENINRLMSETGVEFEINSKRDGHLVVSGTDAEAVEIAVEKITQEVEKIRNGLQRQITEKVFTDKDADVHVSIFSTIIGRKGQYLKTLKLDPTLNISDKYDSEKGEYALIISGNNDEMVKDAVEKLTQEVESVRQKCLNSVTKKVFTHGNVDVHDKIVAKIFGRTGVNIERLRLETGLKFDLHTKRGEQALYVVGTDAEVVESAVEKVTQEVERMHTYLRKPIIMKVPTHTSTAFHRRICKMLIGAKGMNARRFILETGLAFELDATSDKDHVLVSGTDAEVVTLAEDKVKQEVERIKYYFDNQVTETIFTDEDSNAHAMIRNKFIGTKGENIKRFISETGLKLEINTRNDGHFLVSGIDSVEVIDAAEKIVKEIQRIRNDLDLN